MVLALFRFFGVGLGDEASQLGAESVQEGGHTSRYSMKFGPLRGKCGTRFRCCAMSQEKRPRGSPTSLTPTRPLKRIQLSAWGPEEVRQAHTRVSAYVKVT